jgi:Carboxypeptidase regulatory-like domain
VTIRLAPYSVLALLFAAGCEAYHGKLYWAGKSPGYLLERTCASADVGVDAGPSVKFTVMTEERSPLPRAAIRLRSGSPGAIVDYVSNRTGYAEASVPAGTWEVEVKLHGYRTARYVLELPPGQACTLEFRLSIDPEAGYFF